MFKKKSNEIGVGEAIRIIIVTLVALAIPTIVVAYPLYKFAHLHILLSIGAGSLVTFLIVYGLGLHKPVYENQNKQIEK